MIRLRTLSVLEFAGVDTRQFLHNQLSADIRGIPVGGARFACCCNPSGRVLGLLLVAPREDTVFALCAASLAETLQEWLSRFVLRDDVRISLREDLAAAAVGERSAPSLAALDPGVGLRYAIVAAADAGDDPAAEQAWVAREIKAGVAWLDTATSGRFLPQMLGAEAIGALSFSKGCYPGQEVIARTRYLGKLKRYPLAVRVPGEAPLAAGDKPEVIAGGEAYSAEVAAVADAAPGERLALLVVRAAENIVPERLRIGDRDYPATAAGG